MIFHHKLLLSIVIGLTFINIGFAGFNIYIVKLASQTNNPVTLGVLNAVIALGGLIGSTYMTTVLMRQLSSYKKLYLGSITFGILLIMCSFVTHTIVLFVVILGVGCIFLGITQTVINPILQQHTPEHQLGKVFSAMETLSVGVMPIASLVWGVAAQYMSDQAFFIVFGSIYIGAGLLYHQHTSSIC